MSLRSRLVIAVAVALAVSLSLGCALAGWRAGLSVRAELSAALNSGAQLVRTGLDEALLASDPLTEARRLVATFDGNRHVRASLFDGRGTAITGSRLLRPAANVPRWFRCLIAPDLAPADIVVNATPNRIVIRLWADPTNEVGEVWGQVRDVAAALASFCVIATVLGAWTVRRALRPIGLLSAGLSRVGAGDYATRIPEDGPSELAALAKGFNRMAAHLADAQAQNTRLTEQLLTLQEEERADLARDLHDEIGPSLFAVNVTAAMIGQLAATGRAPDIPDHARTIQNVTAQMQRCVRSILGRLRPSRAVEFGLRAAIDSLVAFWSGRNALIDFNVAVLTDESALAEPLKETIYRVVQEGVVNAVRHGQPERIGIVVADRPESVVVEVSDDGAAPDASVRPGFGLGGMRERIAALDGTLSAGPGRQACGWRVVARLPVPARS